MLLEHAAHYLVDVVILFGLFGLLDILIALGVAFTREFGPGWIAYLSTAATAHDVYYVVCSVLCLLIVFGVLMHLIDVRLFDSCTAVSCVIFWFGTFGFHLAGAPAAVALLAEVVPGGLEGVIALIIMFLAQLIFWVELEPKMGYAAELFIEASILLASYALLDALIAFHSTNDGVPLLSFRLSLHFGHMTYDAIAAVVIWFGKPGSSLVILFRGDVAGVLVLFGVLCCSAQVGEVKDDEDLNEPTENQTPPPPTILAINQSSSQTYRSGPHFVPNVMLALLSRTESEAVRARDYPTATSAAKLASRIWGLSTELERLWMQEQTAVCSKDYVQAEQLRTQQGVIELELRSLLSEKPEANHDLSTFEISAPAAPAAASAPAADDFGSMGELALPVKAYISPPNYGDHQEEQPIYGDHQEEQPIYGDHQEQSIPEQAPIPVPNEELYSDYGHGLNYGVVDPELNVFVEVQN